MLKKADRTRLDRQPDAERLVVIGAWGEAVQSLYALTDGERVFICEHNLPNNQDTWYEVASDDATVRVAREEFHMATTKKKTTRKKKNARTKHGLAFDKYSGSALCRWMGSVSTDAETYTPHIAERICGELGITISRTSISTALSDGKHPEQKYGKVPTLNVKEQRKLHALRNRFEREIDREAKAA